MTEIFLIRHGLAGERGSYTNDDERPLTAEGQRKTKQVAHRLKKLGLKFDLILTSPLVRAAQTADILKGEGLASNLEQCPPLGHGGALEDWIPQFDRLRQSGITCLALVGHEPDLSAWAEQLIWGDVRSRLILKKAGVMGLAVPEEGSPIGCCSLFWLSPPRLLL